jgi:hypothetical protein
MKVLLEFKTGTNVNCVNIDRDKLKNVWFKYSSVTQGRQKLIPTGSIKEDAKQQVTV